MHKNKPSRIFFFTGLGADERAFAYLKINVPFQKIYVTWLPPEKNESLASYCRRLTEKYGIEDQDVLIGLSFGGMVATGISRQVNPALTILISSAATRKELPLFYRIAGKTGLYHLISTRFLNKPGRIKHYLFGLRKPEQRQLFDEIITGADISFVRWAIRRVVTWNNKVRPENLVKIHGTADRILPLHKPSTDYVIPGGSHFLTWEKAEEVSGLVNKLLENIPVSA